jgi:hypothetical protein
MCQHQKEKSVFSLLREAVEKGYDRTLKKKELEELRTTNSVFINPQKPAKKENE